MTKRLLTVSQAKQTNKNNYTVLISDREMIKLAYGKINTIYILINLFFQKIILKLTGTESPPWKYLSPFSLRGGVGVGNGATLKGKHLLPKGKFFSLGVAPIFMVSNIKEGTSVSKSCLPLQNDDKVILV